MPTLTIRNVDARVVKRLKARAKSHHRSLEAELREIVTAQARRPTIEEVIARADRIAAMTPKGAEQVDSTDLIREERDRR
jgi:plasmid stability protein